MKDGLNNQIVETMFMVFRSLKETMSFSSKNMHITIVQLETLVFLGENKDVQMKDLADYFSITMPTATSLIDKLIAVNLAERKNYIKDRRIVKITITNFGKKILDLAMKQRASKVNKILSDLSKDDKKEFLRLLSTILEKHQIV